MAAGRHLEPSWKKENRHNSAAISDIFTKFCVLVAIGSGPQRALMSFLGYNIIQDGGRPPFLKTENRNNSAAIWDIVTKFGVVVDMGSPERAVTPFLTGRHLEKRKIAIWDIFTKFGTQVAMDSPQRPLTSLLGYNKIQDGGRPPIGKTENRKNSTAIWDVFTNSEIYSLTKPQILLTKPASNLFNIVWAMI